MTAPMETTMGPTTLQSMATGSGSSRLTHMSPRTMVPSASSTEMVVVTKRVSPSPSRAEAGISTYSGTPEGTNQSRGTVSSLLSKSTPTGNVQQVSSVLTPKTTEWPWPHGLAPLGGPQWTHMSL